MMILFINYAFKYNYLGSTEADVLKSAPNDDTRTT